MKIAATGKSLLEKGRDLRMISAVSLFRHAVEKIQIFCFFDFILVDPAEENNDNKSEITKKQITKYFVSSIIFNTSSLQFDITSPCQTKIFRLFVKMQNLNRRFRLFEVLLCHREIILYEIFCSYLATSRKSTNLRTNEMTENTPYKSQSYLPKSDTSL